MLWEQWKMHIFIESKNTRSDIFHFLSLENNPIGLCMEKDRRSEVKLGHTTTHSKVESGAKLVHYPLEFRSRRAGLEMNGCFCQIPISIWVVNISVVFQIIPKLNKQKSIFFKEKNANFKLVIQTLPSKSTYRAVLHYCCFYVCLLNQVLGSLVISPIFVHHT